MGRLPASEPRDEAAPAGRVPAHEPLGRRCSRNTAGPCGVVLGAERRALPADRRDHRVRDALRRARPTGIRRATSRRVCDRAGPAHGCVEPPAPSRAVPAIFLCALRCTCQAGRTSRGGGALRGGVASPPRDRGRGRPQARAAAGSLAADDDTGREVALPRPLPARCHDRAPPLLPGRARARGPSGREPGRPARPRTDRLDGQAPLDRGDTAGWTRRSPVVDARCCLARMSLPTACWARRWLSVPVDERATCRLYKCGRGRAPTPLCLAPRYRDEMAGRTRVEAPRRLALRE